MASCRRMAIYSQDHITWSALYAERRRFPGLRVSLWHLWPPSLPNYVYCDLNLACRRLPIGPAGPAGVFGHLGVWHVAWPPGCPPVRVLGWFNECEEDRPPASFRSRTGWRYTYSAAATNLLDFVLHFHFLVIVSPLRNSGPCDSFDYLGHSKNVDDDDDERRGSMCASVFLWMHTVLVVHDILWHLWITIL